MPAFPLVFLQVHVSDILCVLKFINVVYSGPYDYKHFDGLNLFGFIAAGTYNFLQVQEKNINNRTRNN